jgi:hypothetical protein
LNNSQDSFSPIHSSTRTDIIDIAFFTPPPSSLGSFSSFSHSLITDSCPPFQWTWSISSSSFAPPPLCLPTHTEVRIPKYTHANTKQAKHPHTDVVVALGRPLLKFRDSGKTADDIWTSLVFVFSRAAPEVERRTAGKRRKGEVEGWAGIFRLGSLVVGF